ncbi:FG-GAP-like repeat-containing protein [Streptomyces sp. SM13]|uniref:FG-GAP-like repeat-containing protein n=1 Tax=Streptomyces sp. SM13 TaxID=1983803 RepID=UPI0011B0EE99|nr:FG-GAP-like repeat-containing protein [Streptomyces sp. SM13]
MPSKSSRRVRGTALFAVVAAAGAMTLSSPAQAVVGDAVADGTYAFTAKLDIGEGDTKRACTGSLVDAQWILTASSCFAAAGQPAFPLPAGAPAEKTTATIGRTDLTGTGGKVVEVTELVSRSDRDLVMAKLAQPVTDIAPVLLADSAPVAGESLRAVGYGRTATSWVPDKLHAGTFDVTATGATTVAVTRDGGAICKGDAGGPALREQNGTVLLAAVHSASWQAGCFGSDETRPGAVESRTDDLTDWVTQVRGLPGESQVASGDFNGDGREDIAAFYDNGPSVEGKNRASLFAFYSNGTGFGEPKRVWSTPGGFTWSKSRLTSGDYTGDGKDDLAVLYDSGSSDTGNITSLYTFTGTGTGFSAPKRTWTTPGGFTWSKSKVTSGDYNGDGKDDVAVFYDSGSSDTGRVSSLYTFNSTGTAFANPRKTWTSSGSFNWNATKLTSGDYSGDGRDDIAVLYNRGTTEAGVHQSALFTFASTGTAFAAPREVWTSTGSFSWAAGQPVSGDFNKDGKADVGVLYRAGTTVDGRRIDSLFSFTSTGTGVRAPVKHWTGSVV